MRGSARSQFLAVLIIGWAFAGGAASPEVRDSLQVQAAGGDAPLVPFIPEPPPRPPVLVPHVSDMPPIWNPSNVEIPGQFSIGSPHLDVPPPIRPTDPPLPPLRGCALDLWLCGSAPG